LHSVDCRRNFPNLSFSDGRKVRFPDRVDDGKELGTDKKIPHQGMKKNSREDVSCQLRLSPADVTDQ
jgi:hypothetical protein